NVFYTFSDGKIIGVWSVIDKAAVERQLRGESAALCADRRV
ncbi:ester cyclase, partial [Pseudomonas syringae]|nr:ester cyclase [Pseudomonas syringae]